MIRWSRNDEITRDRQRRASGGDRRLRIPPVRHAAAAVISHGHETVIFGSGVGPHCAKPSSNQAYHHDRAPRPAPTKRRFLSHDFSLLPLALRSASPITAELRL